VADKAGPPDPAARLRQWYGIAFVLGGMMLFPCLDTLAKALSTRVNVLEIVWARYTFHLLAIPLFVPPGQLSGVFRTRRLGLQTLRSVCAVMGTAFFFLALRRVTLADATAINFVSPLLLTLLAVPLLGERVGAHRLLACAAGFAGALIIVRPGAPTTTWYALLPLVSSFFFALYYVMTRQLSGKDSAATTLLHSALTGAVLTSLALPFVWSGPSSLEWSAMVAMGLIAALAHWLLIKAYGCAPASLLAPYHYTMLVWAAILGYAVFGNIPDTATLLGATVIIGSGLYNAHRELQGRGTPA
jgi:drug/metabolite transporter (DMT)-like permease